MEKNIQVSSGTAECPLFSLTPQPEARTGFDPRRYLQLDRFSEFLFSGSPAGRAGIFDDPAGTVTLRAG
jgi:hypothetical protein